MENKFDYRFDRLTGIFFKVYHGKISFKDLKNSWEHAFKTHIIPNHITGFVLDYRDADMNMTPEESKDISSFYQDHIDVFRNKKVALVMVKPNQVIFPMLVGANAVGYVTRAFYTIEAAVDWVLH